MDADDVNSILIEATERFNVPAEAYKDGAPVFKLQNLATGESIKVVVDDKQFMVALWDGTHHVSAWADRLTIDYHAEDAFFGVTGYVNVGGYSIVSSIFTFKLSIGEDVEVTYS